MFRLYSLSMNRFFLLISMLLLQSPVGAFVVADPSQKTIIFTTDWKAQAEHGGFYQAIAKGFYAREGLKVVIRPGGPQSDNPRLIAAGALDVAMASNGFQPLNLLAAGADVKVVMASFQKDPQVMIVHPHIGAKSFADLKGMPIFMSDSAMATFWPWLKKRFGYDNKQIRKYSYSLAPWLVNKNSVQEGYLSSEPFSAQKAGVKPDVLLFADAGYPGYAGMVMVRGAYLRENGALVRSFVKASIAGWQDYIWGDPSAGNALILHDNREMTPELLAYAIKAMKDNNMVGPRASVGQMSHKRWGAFFSEMSALGLFDPALDVKKAYTLDFITSTQGQN
ncbi:MAG: ABC transporter substrate-binding protein [Kordiimonadaceae bacterium]|nr:ABC transporter substrate-binding protein [Kordiimonadaceae bacterium]